MVAYRQVWLFAFVVGCSGSSGDQGHDAGTSPDATGLPPGAYCATGANSTSAGGAELTLDLDVGTGPLQQVFQGAPIQVVSPLPIADTIYGINQYPEDNYFLNYPHTQWGLMRWGGDSYSAYNWMTNAENNGADNGYESTNQFLPYAYGSVPTDPSYHGQPHDTNQAGAFVDGNDSIPAAQTRHVASLATVSLQAYVPANANDQAVTYAPSADFIANRAAQASGGGQVYQDAFVKFVKANYDAAPVFYSLDNEPNYWHSTHPEVFGTNDLAFDDLVTRGATFATAVKTAVPSALVFGPVVAGLDGMTSLDDYGNLASTNPYAASGTDAIEYYLAHMATASTAAGMRLLDVLDLHYYNDTVDKTGTKKTGAQCAQGPRDYWDATYSTPDTSYDDYITGWKPRVLIPRMLAKIAANDPGTGLSFSEYNNGCEHEIGGGVAEADLLGVFGQYGVFAATAWPLQTVGVGTNWLIGAFDAFRNYDGAGAIVGSLAIGATTPDAGKVSVYGFVHPGKVGIEVVAINKTAAAITTEIRLSNACVVTTATPYQLTSANAAMVAAGQPIAITGNALAYTLPAMSVTTLVLR
jgi:hypothetical protein